jgi:glycopeptide antibiotics resistance protein
MSWPVFLTVCGAMLAFGLAIIVRGYFDDRQWDRQKAAEDAAKRAAAE